MCGYASLGPGQHLGCANFCAHPSDRWAHSGTASHMLRSRLSCFVSAVTLKTGGLFRVVRLPWAQEVRGSNPRPPIKSLQLSELEEVDFGGAAFWCNVGTIRKIPKLSAPETCRKHMQTLNTKRASCVSGRRTVGTFRRANCFPMASSHTPIRRLRENWSVYPRSSAPAS